MRFAVAVVPSLKCMRAISPSSYIIQLSEARRSVVTHFDICTYLLRMQRRCTPFLHSSKQYFQKLGPMDRELPDFLLIVRRGWDSDNIATVIISAERNPDAFSVSGDVVHGIS